MVKAVERLGTRSRSAAPPVSGRNPLSERRRASVTTNGYQDESRSFDLSPTSANRPTDDARTHALIACGQERAISSSTEVLKQTLRCSRSVPAAKGNVRDALPFSFPSTRDIFPFPTSEKVRALRGPRHERAREGHQHRRLAQAIQRRR